MTIDETIPRDITQSYAAEHFRDYLKMCIPDIPEPAEKDEKTLPRRVYETLAGMLPGNGKQAEEIVVVEQKDPEEAAAQRIADVAGLYLSMEVREKGNRNSLLLPSCSKKQFLFGQSHWDTPQNWAEILESGVAMNKISCESAKCSMPKKQAILRFSISIKIIICRYICMPNLQTSSAMIIGS